MAAVASTDTGRTLRSAIGLAVEVDGVLTLKAEVEGFVASPSDRPSTLVRRLDAFETLKMRAALYRDVFQVYVADLDKTLADLTTSIETLLNEKAAA